ncbi:toxin-antitoxin system TumE family protein, partial [Methanocaldococcus sp.]
SKIIKDFKILDFKEGNDFYYLKIEAILIDDGKLYIKEHVSNENYIYSFHWQDKNGDLIVRWDNAPHYKNIKTFPHHKHTKNGVEESDEVCLEDVLKYIENQLNNNYLEKKNSKR